MEEKHIPLIWRIWLLHIEIFGIYKTCFFENLGAFLWKTFEDFGINLLFSFGIWSFIAIDEFQKKFSPRILQRYLLHSKDIRKEQDLILLPMYMSMFL